MTVRELISELENWDDDTKVVFSHQSGDYWRTVLATEVKNLEIGHIRKSDYHNGFQISEEIYDETDEDDEKSGYKGNNTEEVLVLS